ASQADNGQADNASQTENAGPSDPQRPFAIAEAATLDEPWALAMEPGTGRVFVTEKPGTIKWYDPESGQSGPVEGDLPTVANAGQGGLGDIAFAPDYADSKAIYLT